MADNGSDTKKSTDDYRVGYRKPPAGTRFQKGKSGNPTGRPKGTPNFATALERALGEQVVVNEGGQRYAVSKLEAAVKQLVNKATMGDARATQQLLHVIHVLDEEPSEVNKGIPTTEADARVIAHLIERLTSTKEENANDAHR